MGEFLSEFPTFLYILPLAMIAVGLFVAGRTFWQLRALSTAEPMHPGKARPGYARLEGTAEPRGKPLLAPLTGAPCLWYRIRVEQSVHQTDTEKRAWQTIRSDESEKAFDLAWEGARIRIDPSGADVTPQDRSLWYGRTETPEDRNPPRFLPSETPADGGPTGAVTGGAGQYRYSEDRIYPGNPLFALGEVFDTGKGRLELARPTARSLPYVISTTEPAEHLSHQRLGIVGALLIAGLGAALLAVMLLA